MVGAQEDLTCGVVSGLTALNASHAGITSGVGIQNLTGLTSLSLRYNSITAISPLTGLTGLTRLDLDGNSISDIGPSACAALSQARGRPLVCYPNSARRGILDKGPGATPVV